MIKKYFVEIKPACKQLIAEIKCKLTQHKFGKVYSYDEYYVAVKCERCGYVSKSDKQTLREVMFGIFDDD